MASFGLVNSMNPLHYSMLKNHSKSVVREEMSQKLKIAGIQCDVQIGDVEANLTLMKRHLADLANENLFLIAFPECFLQGYCYDSLEAALAAGVSHDDEAVQQVIRLATAHDVHIVFGFLQRDGDVVYNSCGMATRHGDLHLYHKVHLPKLGVDQFTTPGNTFQPVQVDGVSIGMNICYDCSFPEPARLLALQDVDLIVLPTNWPPGAGSTADFIPNARALENNIYYMAINRVGEERGFRFIGKSKICHPDGYDLAFADHENAAILMAEFDPSVARNKHLVRVPDKHEIHRFADRRPEYYRDIAENIKTERV